MKGTVESGKGEEATIPATGKPGKVRQEITPKPLLAIGDGDGARFSSKKMVDQRSLLVTHDGPSHASGLSPDVGRERESERECGRTFANWALQVPNEEWLRRRSNCGDGLPVALPVSHANLAKEAEMRVSQELAEEREEKAAFHALQV